MSENYNGSKNYETWTVGLWLNNDQGPYYTCKSLVEEAGSVSGGADAIQEYVEEMNPLADNASVFSDLLTAALQSVDWREIAADFKPDEWGDSDEAPKDDPEDDPDEPEGTDPYADEDPDRRFPGVFEKDASIPVEMTNYYGTSWLRPSDVDYWWRDDHNVYSRE